MGKNENTIYDDYRVEIVGIEQVSDFKYLESRIRKDEELLEYGLVDSLIVLLAKHRTHMLDRIDEAIENY